LALAQLLGYLKHEIKAFFNFLHLDAAYSKRICNLHGLRAERESLQVPELNLDGR